MSIVIKNGTVVTADMTYKADVRLQGSKIESVGPNLIGRQGIGRKRLLRHARRHRPAYPSRDAVYGYLHQG